MTRPFRLRTLVAVAVIVAGSTVSADAATFSVTNTTDSGPGSLRDAIAAANASSGPDVIDFAPGVAGTITLTSGQLELTDAVEIRGPGADVLTVSGGGSSRVFMVGGVVSATIAGLTVADGAVAGGTGGNASGGDGGDGGPGSFGNPDPGTTGGAGGSGIGGGGLPAFGAGVRNHGELTLERVVVRDNAIAGGDGGTASGGDGGSGGQGGNASATGSGGPGGSGGAGGEATGGDGGAAFGGGIYNLGSLTLRASTVSGNSATGGDGGSVTGGNGGDGGVGGNGTNGNAGGAGGAGGFGSDASAGKGGDATGAGIYNAGTLVVENSTVSGNSANVGPFGGNASGGDAGSTGANGSPGGGSAGTGGAGGDGGGATGATSGVGSGAGIVNASINGAVLRGVTVAGNASGAGSNIMSRLGEVSLRGTIVAVPSGPFATNCSVITGGTVDSVGHNLESANSCGLDQPTDRPSSNAELGPLAANGGSTPTRRLGSGSRALDAIPAGDANCLASDQRGAVRPGGAACDIGAYEVSPPVATTGDAQDVGPNGGTLTGTVEPRGLATTYLFEYGPTAAYGSQTPPAGAQAPGAVAASAAVAGLSPLTTYHYRVVATGPDGTATGADRSFTTTSDPDPRISGLALSRTRFAVGPQPTPIDGGTAAQRVPRGTTIRFRLSEAASVALTMQRSTRGLRLRRGVRCLRSTPGNRRRATRLIVRRLGDRARGPDGRSNVRRALRRAGCKRFDKVGTLRRSGRAGANTVPFSGRIGRRPLRPRPHRVSVVATDAAGNRSAPRRAGFRIVRSKKRP